MLNKKMILSVIFLLSIFILMPGKTPRALADETDSKICKGVFIDEVDVSGMTKAEAKEAVDNFVDSLRAKGVAFKVGDDVVYTALGDIDYSAEENADIDEALSLGMTGNLIKRYKDLKDIEEGKKIYPLTFTIDDKKLDEVITDQVGAYNIAPVNASVSRKNGKFVYTDHVVGSKVDVNKTAEALKAILFNNWNRTDIIVDAVMEDDMPAYTSDMVKLCNAKLGSYTTEYTTSAQGRAANLANGARLINNTVLYPGEVFSGYEYLHPFTSENGYYTAGAYLDGKLIDSVGGGACQVTTTLYNAALLSELEVVQRQPHSMTISYVDLSRDAAIAGTYKDLKFKNSTDAPILIQAYTKDRTITFIIWGHETRDTSNRRIEFESKVVSETPPPADVIKKDPTKPTTYQEVTQAAHTGYKAELYKVVYENGKEVSRELINKSSYSAAPRYITIGTKKEAPAADKDESKKNNDKKNKPADKNTSKNDSDKNTKKDTDQDDTEDDAEDIQAEDEDTETNINSITPGNRANPDNQLQGDIWDPSWEDEDIEE